MARLEWKPGFKTNNKIVDLQHQYFVELINRLHDELGETSDSSYQVRLLDELLQYAHFHFTSEENIFLKLSPIKFFRHKLLHDRLLTDLERKVEDLKNGQSDASSIIMFVVEWFITHTLAEDIKDFQ